ncbi:MAG TPA: phosphate ABC transporter permease PstA [Solirubrobacteraceae bacterium]|nr:phosphate ABC transporter permease PstA [Solirubrobacteraceae bacterium]
MEAGSLPVARTRLAGGPGHRRRRTVNRIMEIVCSLAAAVAVALLLLVVISVLLKGIPAINIDFLTKDPAPFGQSGGGIANSIVGSAILVGLATLISVPIAILVAIYTTEFAGARVATVIRFALDILNGIPTIVTGVFIFGLLVVGHQQSGWAGAIALAIVELPVVARGAQEVLELVPRSLHEAGLALGLRRWRIVLRIVLPTAVGGLITGAVLGVARVAGETAPLLLTSSIFSNLGITTSPSSALPNIPVTIFGLSESSSPSDHAQAWAAAFVLIMFVLILSVIARAFHERSRRRLRS